MLEIEKHIPQENWFVGLLFDEGYWFFQTVRKQQTTNYKPFIFNSGNLVYPSTTYGVSGYTGWEAPADAVGRFYLEPQEEETAYQIFTGIAPSNARLYLQYTQREDRMNLITPRPVPGNIGFWDGEETPYDDPSPKTELWSVHNLYPHMLMENYQWNAQGYQEGNHLRRLAVSFWITPYTYKVVTDKSKVLQFLRKEKPATIKTMGDGYRPVKAPAWMLSQYGSYFVQPEEV